MPGIAASRCSSAVSAPRRFPARVERTRTRIIEAATQHFAEHGSHACASGDIAMHLGHRQGFYFQHFGSKDGLSSCESTNARFRVCQILDAPAELRQAGSLTCCGIAGEP